MACPVALNLQDMKSKREPVPMVFADLDGTLCPTEMHHVVYYFIRGLPSARQRLTKLALYFPVLGLGVGPARCARGVCQCVRGRC